MSAEQFSQNPIAGVYHESSSAGKKVLLVILVLLFLTALSLGAFLFIKKGLPGKKTPPGQEALKTGPGEQKTVVAWKQPEQFLAAPTQPQETDIANQVLSWLEDQRDDRGVYIYGYRCSTSSCETQGKDNKSGLAVMWGYLKHFQKTQDQNDLTVIKRNLDLYSNEAVIPTIQNDFWDCKLMYDLWQSGLFSDSEKTKITAICYRGNYNFEYLTEINNKISQGQTQTIDFKGAISKKAEASLNPQSYSSNNGPMVEISATASEFVSRYLWKNNADDLTRAKLYFDKAVNVLTAEPVVNYLEGKCVLGIAGLDLFVATKDKNYLDTAQLIFAKEKIKDICLDVPKEGITSYCYNSAFEQAACGIFASQLKTLTNDTQYQTLTGNVTTNVVNNLFNLPQYDTGEEGKGAFYTKVIYGSETLVRKTIRENGLLVGFLMLD